MELSIQIYSFIVSFLFGGCFYFLLDLFNKLTGKFKLVLKILFSFFFIIVISLLYFLILLYVNNGVVHIYFLLSILVGYLFVYLLINRWFTYKQKK